MDSPTTVKELDELIQSFSGDLDEDGILTTESFRNGLVLALHKNTIGKKVYLRTAKSILTLAEQNSIHCTNEDAVRQKIKRLDDEILEKRKHISRVGRGQAILGILLDSFQFPEEKCHKPHVNIDDQIVPQWTAPPPSPKQLKADCPKCITFREDIKKLRATIQTSKKEEKSNYIKWKKEYDVILKGRRNQDHQRKLKQIVKLRGEKRVLKTTVASKDRTTASLRRQLKLATDNQSEDLQKEMTNLRKSKGQMTRSHEAARDLHTSKVKTLNSKIKDLDATIINLQKEIDYMKAEIEEMQQETTVIETKDDKKWYNMAVRKSLYNCLIHEVPVDAACTVISYSVDTMTGKQLSTTPCRSTTSQMAYELGVLCDIQVTEALLSEKNVTLAWDATTVGGAHINEVHVATSSGYLSLQIGKLAGGTQIDYAMQVIECINDISSSYAHCHGLEPLGVKQSIIKSIKNTLSDRCIVNHRVVKQLEERLDIELLELKCNVHPLDGLACSARKTLRDLEKGNFLNTGPSGTYGNDCRAANLIYGICKMRYRNGADPDGFTVFLETSGLPIGTILRYVGNRLHVLFHMAGVVYHLQKQLINYLSNYCKGPAELRNALLKDLQNPVIISELRALGLLGKLLTGPWMVELYRSQHTLSNLETVPLLKKCVQSVQIYHEDPIQCMTLTVNAFGNALPNDAVLNALRQPFQNDTEEEVLLRIVSSMAENANIVLKRQMDQYLTGNLSSPTAELLDQAKSAPAHNMQAERILGMTDAMIKRAPNATMGFIDGKVRGKTNSVLMWLDSKPVSSQKKLVKTATLLGQRMRKLKHQREKLIAEKKKEKQKTIAQQRDKTMRKKLERQVKAMADEVTIAGVSQLFPDLTATDAESVFSILSDPKWFVDKSLLHIWEDEGENTLFNGKVLKLKRKGKVHRCVISYWKPDKDIKHAEDFEVPITEIVVDLVCGELTIL